MPIRRDLNEQPDIPLASLWVSVRRGLPALTIAAVVIGGLTWGYLALMAPRYQSEAQLAIVAKSTNPFPDARERGADAMLPRLDREAVNTHVRALIAPDLLLKVARDLRLAGRPEFNIAAGDLDLNTTLLRAIGLAGARPGESEDERVLATMLRQLEVSAVKESRFIGIRFTSADAQLAADLANALAEAYRASLVRAPVQETSDVVTALAPKVEQLKRELIEVEAEVERFRASTDQFRGGPQSTPISDQRMAALSDELVRTESLRSEIEGRWRAARELAQSGSAETLPDVQKSPLIQSLVGQRVRLERQVAEASAALLPAHPRMQQLNADVAGLRRQIAAEVSKVVQSLEKDYRAAALRVESITRQIDSLKVKVVDQSGNEARLRALESSAKAKRVELERLQKQLEDNRTVVNIQQVPIEAQLISRARPSGVVAYPKKGLSLVLTMSATMILGLAFLVTRGLVTGPVPTADLRAGAPAPGTPSPRPQLSPALAGTVRREAAPATAGAGRRAAALAPALAALADRLVARQVATGLRTLICGAEEAIDVSPEALALAQHLSAAGMRVVVVDWSLSGRTLGRIGHDPARAGLLDLLQGTASFEQVVGSIPDIGVHVIHSGAAPRDADPLLEPDRLSLALDALDEAYDQIIVAGRHGDARRLFEAIEGRFDAGVIIQSAGPQRVVEGGDSEFLGFEVSDIDIVCLSRGVAAPADKLAGVRPMRAAETPA